MKDITKLIKNPPKKYRPLPFWSWNAKLETEETTWQVGEMDRVGNGGFFMHARGGLITEYMGKEWMDNVRAAVLDADKRGMNAWGYDENGYPSGFGSDMVNGLGLEYQQKYLRMEITDEPMDTEFTISNKKLEDGKNAHFYYEVNTFYIDALNPKVTEKFIEVTHEKYKEALGKDFSKMAGFFTDEPQLSRKGLPWSLILEDEYQKEYGENLAEYLYDMFADTETCYRTRYRFWKLVTRLFCENYMKKIYDWCNENGTQLTGHMVIEESIHDQIDCNGAIMPNYEYFHIPGIDKLCRSVNRSLLVPQVISAAAQLGKKQILTESFAMCGWDVSFEELKWILEWQMVKGVNLLCQHLSGYSLEGLRKRDYPAGHAYQNPWWNEYKAFMDFSSRMGMLLAEGELHCDVLVLHTIASGWVLRGSDESLKTAGIYHKSLTDVEILLDQNQITHHLGDERIMARHAKVNGNKISVGKMTYSTVIIPSASVIDSNTYYLLKEFSDNGGNLIFAGEVPTYIDGIASNKVVELSKVHAEALEDILPLIPESAKYCSIVLENGKNADIQFARRSYDDFEMFYFVNTFSDKCENVTLTVPGKSCAAFDYLTGEIIPCEFSSENGCVTVTHTFEKMGSYVLFVRNDDTYKSVIAEEKNLVPLNDKLRGEWNIAESDMNSLTLDYCDCYFDGELYKDNIYVLDIQENACALERKVNIKLDFNVRCNMTKTAPMYLVIERPEFYTISINGKEIEKKECGYYRDKSFKMLDITGLFTNGDNKITLVCDFVQSEEVYESFKKSSQKSFETAKNKLYYDMEIEDIYIVGDFGVDNTVPYEFDEHRTVRATEGNFSICDRPQSFTDGDFTSQKHPFFCGHMKVRKEIELTADEIQNRSIKLSRRCSTVYNFTVNGTRLDDVFWAPYETDISGLLKPGKNIIELDITGCFRNMLGPHHTKIEAYDVYPHSFLHISDVWYGGLYRWGGWYDGYSFVEYGLFLE